MTLLMQRMEGDQLLCDRNVVLPRATGRRHHPDSGLEQARRASDTTAEPQTAGGFLETRQVGVENLWSGVRSVNLRIERWHDEKGTPRICVSSPSVAYHLGTKCRGISFHQMKIRGDSPQKSKFGRQQTARQSAEPGRCLKRPAAESHKVLWPARSNSRAPARAGRASAASRSQSALPQWRVWPLSDLGLPGRRTHFSPRRATSIFLRARPPHAPAASNHYAMQAGALSRRSSGVGCPALRGSVFQRAYRGANSCVEYWVIGSTMRGKSRDGFCPARTKLSLHQDGLILQGVAGRTRRPLTLRRSAARTSAQRSGGLPESSSRQTPLSSPSSTKCSRGLTQRN